MQHPEDQDMLNVTIDSVGDMPVFLKFTAEWCGPCKMIQPRLDELAKEYEGKVIFISVDVDVFEPFSA